MTKSASNGLLLQHYIIRDYQGSSKQIKSSVIRQLLQLGWFGVSSFIQADTQVQGKQ